VTVIIWNTYALKEKVIKFDLKEGQKSLDLIGLKAWKIFGLF
jgi:hypothetical protein